MQPRECWASRTQIIAVDDASTDATSAVAMRQGARVVQVRCRQISAVPKRRFAQAGGELLVFVDADTDVPRAVVDAAVHALRTGAVGGACSAASTSTREQGTFQTSEAWGHFNRALTRLKPVA